MFDDPKRELQELEKKLLEQDDRWLDRQLSEARSLLQEENEEEDLFRKFGDSPAVRNTDRSDVELDSYSDALLEEPEGKRERGVRGLLVLIALELLGIAAIGVYWLVQLS